jgi:starvation-inducible outer membrane lipoprotein
MMTRFIGAVLLCTSLALGACAPTSVFPSGVQEGVDPNFDFARWRMLPNQAEHRKLQLGGAILQTQSRNGQVIIVATNLPIVEHPAYGPRSTDKARGEFAIVFSGSIEAKALHAGNKVMVVGTTQPSKVVTLDDMPRSLPTVEAQCVHIWITGPKDIADFPFNTGGGYEPLEENTYCVQRQ